MRHVRKKDMAEVISGREKGKRGEVIHVEPQKGRVFVQKLNMVKRHTKPSQKHPQGGIIEKEGGIALSSVRVVCPKCDRGRRLRRQVLDDGTLVRICGTCGETIGNW